MSNSEIYKEVFIKSLAVDKEKFTPVFKLWGDLSTKYYYLIKEAKKRRKFDKLKKYPQFLVEGKKLNH